MLKSTFSKRPFGKSFPQAQQLYCSQSSVGRSVGVSSRNHNKSMWQNQGWVGGNPQLEASDHDLPAGPVSKIWRLVAASALTCSQVDFPFPAYLKTAISTSSYGLCWKVRFQNGLSGKLSWADHKNPFLCVGRNGDSDRKNQATHGFLTTRRNRRATTQTQKQQGKSQQSQQQQQGGN